MPKKTFLVTGPINSGKTTRLIEWCKNRNDVHGILTPKINGRRFFMDAYTGEKFEMDAAENEVDVLRVGKYVFSIEAFNRAREIVKIAGKQKNVWLIIDEIGQLELKGEGFNSELKNLLLTKDDSLLVILVVRDTLLKEVSDFYGISDRSEMFHF